MTPNGGSVRWRTCGLLVRTSPRSWCAKLSCESFAIGVLSAAMWGSEEHHSPAAVARAAMVELAWMWLRWQPGSALSNWFRARLGQPGSRIKKIMIVALARKLLVALWRYVKDGVIPEGAKMKTA